MQNKTKATLTLTASAILALGTLPTSPVANLVVTNAGKFFLGLFNHGFIAATIGGLADWFAITALFHKPLGIKYRTEILKRNRGRITDALMEFVGNDLLNTKNIMDTFKNENTAKLLIDFFEQYRGRDKVKKLSYEILSELFSNIDSDDISRKFSPILKNEIKNLDVEKIIDAAVKVVTTDKHSRRILISLLQTAQKILKTDHMQMEISKKISELREAYQGDSAGRALVLASMNLTDEKILDILNENVDRKINDAVRVLKHKTIIDTEDEAFAKNLLEGFVNSIKFETKNLNIKQLQIIFESLIDQNVDISNYIKNWIDVNIRGEESSDVLEKFSRQSSANFQQGQIVEVEYHETIWQDSVEYLIDEKINEFIKNVDWQEKFDSFVKKVIEHLLEEYHGQIPILVRERLDKFSDDELNSFVEEKVSDDLQMIRINGSVCGGIVGMVLFIIASLLGKIGG